MTDTVSIFVPVLSFELASELAPCMATDMAYMLAHEGETLLESAINVAFPPVALTERVEYDSDVMVELHYALVADAVEVVAADDIDAEWEAICNIDADKEFPYWREH